MYCAYLKTDNQWNISYSQTEAINHHDSIVIFDEKPTDEQILEAIQEQEPNLFVSFMGNGPVIVTDRPYVHTLRNGLLQETLKEHTEVYVGYIAHTTTSRKIKSRDFYIVTDRWTNGYSYENIVFEKVKDQDYLLARVDVATWTLIKNKIDQKNQKNKERRQNELVTFNEIRSHVFGLRTGSFYMSKPTPGDLVTAILANDFYKGKDETNSRLKEVAIKWLKHPEENEARFLENNWATEEQIEFIVKRFKTIVKTRGKKK